MSKKAITKEANLLIIEGTGPDDPTLINLDNMDKIEPTTVPSGSGSLLRSKMHLAGGLHIVLPLTPRELKNILIPPPPKASSKKND